MDSIKPMIKEQLNANAPGLFFASPPTHTDPTPVIKQGNLAKHDRSRGALSFLVSPKWQEREFRIFESTKCQYFEGGKLDLLYFFVLY